eukprot:109196_1
MNIALYLESYSPHVILQLLLFDLADRSSFHGIVNIHKSLLNLYESLEEKTEYDWAAIQHRCFALDMIALIKTKNAKDHSMPSLLNRMKNNNSEQNEMCVHTNHTIKMRHSSENTLCE